ncbi:hypothetical protein MUK42_07230 [Musa troglodytarum]|uniref:Uncharacterized protein n=1 Tax=Musa troglodytarum TaxID=320322 RepID=A0A9E7K495_9LILI|nr:hypothetical protein MUK42_07230 [Musa troglodytarum]
MQQRSAAVGRMARISPAAWSSISGTSKVAKGKSRLGVRSPPSCFWPVYMQATRQVVWNCVVLLSTLCSKFESFAAIAVSVGFISLVLPEHLRYSVLLAC